MTKPTTPHHTAQTASSHGAHPPAPDTSHHGTHPPASDTSSHGSPDTSSHGVPATSRNPVTTLTIRTKLIIKELEALINKGNAHASFEEAVRGISLHLLGAVPNDVPYSIWQLVEHIRIAQWDILEFSRNPNHQSPKWPDDYWPKERKPSDSKAWKKSLDQIASDRKAFTTLLHEAGEELYTPFPYGNGQSLLREALLIADHTSYHTGEIILLRRILEDWK